MDHNDGFGFGVRDHPVSSLDGSSTEHSIMHIPEKNWLSYYKQNSFVSRDYVPTSLEHKAKTTNTLNSGSKTEPICPKSYYTPSPSILEIKLSALDFF